MMASTLSSLQASSSAQLQQSTKAQQTRAGHSASHSKHTARPVRVLAQVCPVTLLHVHAYTACIGQVLQCGQRQLQSHKVFRLLQFSLLLCFLFDSASAFNRETAMPTNRRPGYRYVRAMQALHWLTEACLFFRGLTERRSTVGYSRKRCHEAAQCHGCSTASSLRYAPHCPAVPHVWTLGSKHSSAVFYYALQHMGVKVHGGSLSTTLLVTAAS